MKWFRRLFQADDWRLCGIIEVPIIETHPRRDDKKGKLSYYLYENQFGDRKFDAVDTFRGDLQVWKLKKNDFTFRCEDYMTQVKPWLEGRHVKGIASSYDKVPQHNFKQKLEEGD